MESEAGSKVPLSIMEEPLGIGSNLEDKNTFLFDKVLKSRENTNAYRDSLLLEKKKLREETELLESENYSLAKGIKELEIQLLEKNNILKKVTADAQRMRKTLTMPMIEENSLMSELKFLESEKTKLVDKYGNLSEELSEHITMLGNTILNIDFIKGEIETLREKAHMVERSVPQKFVELDYLEEKIIWTEKALTELYKSMKNVENKTKLFYYMKG
ncbi:MAG: hypothetical protein HQK94_09165 [Nitrospirae bacterium]|nr:hypothetical protein [Nitrospirota bacterium]